MRTKYFLGSAGGLALMASLAAQTPPAQQPPPGQGQPGLLPANLPPPYPTALYRMTDVGKAISLTPEQFASLNKLTDQVQAQYRDDFAKVNALKEAERFGRLQELNRLYATAWDKGAQDILNQTQRARYQQLNYQYGGFNTLYDPDVQKRLDLTATQVRDLRTQVDWSEQQLQAINRAAAADAEKGARMYRDYWAARQNRLNSLLTADQLKAWNAMVGEPYTFQPTIPPPGKGP
jgi:hypothetical protein